jgi:hypothetical protein
VEEVRVGDDGERLSSTAAVLGVMPDALAALMGLSVYTLMGGMVLSDGDDGSDRLKSR